VCNNITNKVQEVVSCSCMLFSSNMFWSTQPASGRSLKLLMTGTQVYMCTKLKIKYSLIQCIMKVCSDYLKLWIFYEITIFKNISTGQPKWM